MNKTLATITLAYAMATTGCGYNIADKITSPRMEKAPAQKPSEDKPEKQYTPENKDKAPKYEIPKEIRIPAETCQYSNKNAYRG